MKCGSPTANRGVHRVHGTTHRRVPGTKLVKDLSTNVPRRTTVAFPILADDLDQFVHDVVDDLRVVDIGRRCQTVTVGVQPGRKEVVLFDGEQFRVGGDVVRPGSSVRVAANLDLVGALEDDDLTQGLGPPAAQRRRISSVHNHLFPHQRHRVTPAGSS